MDESVASTPRLFALFVGINRYPLESRLGRLYGCVADVTAMSSLLETRTAGRYVYYPRLLKDELATRKEVINGFREHLGAANADDTVLFMYAGHGSRQRSARAFTGAESTAWDETLVCYDSRLCGQYDLADKELAVLLTELKARKVLVILDCCHSGSGTRMKEASSQLMVRHASEIPNERPLQSYLDGYYQAQLPNPIIVPLHAHILLAACSPHQKAAEIVNSRGVFSNALEKALEGEGMYLTYQALFARCRAILLQDGFWQSPQFECFGGEDPWSTFLDISKGEPLPPSLVVYEGMVDRWFVDFGVLHGLGTGTKQALAVEVFDNGKSLGEFQLQGLGPERSELQVPMDTWLPTSSALVAVPRFIPAPPICIFLDLASWQMDIARAFLPPYLNLEVCPVADFAQYHIVPWRDGLALIDTPAKRLLQYTDNANKASIVALIDILRKVIQWERLRELSNAAQEVYFEKAELEFSLVGVDGSKIVSHASGEVLPYSGNDGRLAYYPIFRMLNRTSFTLYVYLFYQSRHFGIELLEWREFPPSDEQALLWGKHDGNGFYLPNDLDQSTEIFKVMISTEPLQSWLIAQQGFVVGGKSTSGARDQPLVALTTTWKWVARTFEVGLQRMAK
jgi:hypothetical protein